MASDGEAKTTGVQEDDEAAAEEKEREKERDQAREQFCRLRNYATKAFSAFLRHLNSPTLRKLEQSFTHYGNTLRVGEFIGLCMSVFPTPDAQAVPSAEDRLFISRWAALTLFKDVDVTACGQLSWIQFVEFVVAKSDLLRRQDMWVPAAFRGEPAKHRFDRIFYWPEHPSDTLIAYEDGDEHFWLHSAPSLHRRRKVVAHRSDILTACFMPEPFNWIVTSGNDKSIVFWDTNFNEVRRWNLDFAVGAFCWVQELHALYVADHFDERVMAWRIHDPMQVRDVTQEKNRKGVTPLKFDKELEFHSGHEKPVQTIIWMAPLQQLATASLDCTVRIFDLVQLRRTHVLQGHTKGLTILEYSPKRQMLLSGGFDNYITLWEPGAGTKCHVLEGHECSIADIRAVPEVEHEILSVDFAGTVKLWDLRQLACIQTFHAHDLSHERNGEPEPMEPRMLQPLGKDKLVVAGRNTIVFTRDTSDPHQAADSQITAVAFCRRKMEIVTPVKDSLRVWDALSGRLLVSYPSVIEGNITCVAIGVEERRLFVGSEKGVMNVLNYACCAKLKPLQAHSGEVTQILTIPTKVLTLSTTDRTILVHDDTQPKRSSVLKTIDLSHVPTVLSISSNLVNIVAATTEDGDVYWYNTDSAKQAASSIRSPVQHSQVVSCVRYFRNAPLIATADLECRLIFWSVQPLRPFSVFAEAELELGGRGSPKNKGVIFGITTMAIEDGDEYHIFVGTDHGTVACLCVQPVVELAEQQREELLQQESADMLGDPDYQPEVRLAVKTVWFIDRAHRGNVDQIIFCVNAPPVIISLGADIRVRVWSHDTGEVLGSLEQGSAEGLVSRWRWPLDGKAMQEKDRLKLDQALAMGHWEPPSSPRDEAKELTNARAASKKRTSLLPNVPGQGAPRHSEISQAGRARKGLGYSGSAPNLCGGRMVSSPSPEVKPRYLRSTRRTVVFNQEWLAGSMHPTNVSSGLLQLPQLDSGLCRPKASDVSEVVRAAKRLSDALHEV